jgi:hypothetical protein
MADFRFLKTAPAQWLDKEILDVIDADNVASVVCFLGDSRNPGVYTYPAGTRSSGPDDTRIPEAEALPIQLKIDQVFDALAPLTLDDVQGSKGDSPVMRIRPSPVWSMISTTAVGYPSSPMSDGGGEERYTLEGDRRYGRRGGAAAADAAAAGAPEDEAPKGEVEAPETAAPATKTARQLNEELSPWVFSVKKWQFDSFITRPESLLEEVKTEGNGSS